MDLVDFVDWSGVECLNQSTSHSLINAVKQVIGRRRQLSFIRRFKLESLLINFLGVFVESFLISFEYLSFIGIRVIGMMMVCIWRAMQMSNF